MTKLVILGTIIIMALAFIILTRKNRARKENAYGDKDAIGILKQKNIPLLEEKLTSLGDDWAQRYFYASAMSRSFPLEKLEQWATNKPQSAEAHLVLGARLLQLAWTARGYGKGNEISDKNWQKFYELLEKTESALLQSAKLNNQDPTPWALLVMVAAYQQEDTLESTYFNEAIDRDPDNWIAHMHRLMGRTKKWGGSHEEMLTFARDTNLHAKKGSVLPILILKAHLEIWKYHSMFEGDDDAAYAYLQNEKVRDECLAAYKKSLGTHTYDENTALFARYNATAWLWLTKERAPLANELNHLHNRLQDIHWVWCGTEGDVSAAKKFANI